MLQLQQLEQQVNNVQESNKKKQKIRKLLLKLDQQKLGCIPNEAFFQILELNQICLNQSEKNSLVKVCQGQSTGGEGVIKYRDAIAMISINQDNQWEFMQNSNKDMALTETVSKLTENNVQTFEQDVFQNHALKTNFSRSEMSKVHTKAGTKSVVTKS